MSYFIELPFPLQALIAGLFTWGITALGAALVFAFRKINKFVLDAMLGFAAGVMIAASFFSLLAPAAEMATSLKMIPWLICFVGFFCGGLVLFIGDKIYSHYLNKFRKNHPHNEKMKRIWLLFYSITLHNIPEGLAIGVAFGALAFNLEGATLASALALALGIGLQNFPEGSALSIPIFRETKSRKKAFFLGQLSGIVEPIAAFFGALLVLRVQYMLPFCLAFAAGAMIYVVVEELIPESQTNRKKDLMALFTIIGFSIMMILDLALG